MKLAAVLAILALALAVPLPAAGQLADRVQRVGDGTVRLEYDIRDDVEICDQGVRIGDDHMWWRSRGWDDGPTRCRYGSAELELTLRDGQVRDVELVRSLEERSEGAVELGAFGGAEVATFLLGLAREGATERGAKAALLPAMIADADETWRELLAIAQDRRVPDEVRERALFWVGQEAAEAVTAGLSDVALADDEEQDVRNAAIFALSQRSADQSVPVLIDLARSAREAETRRRAMFWLAQRDDARVVAFFEDILLGRER